MYQLEDGVCCKHSVMVWGFLVKYKVYGLVPPWCRLV